MNIINTIRHYSEERPEEHCFVHRDETLSYKMLEELSNGLASKIKMTSKPVIIYGHMNKWMIIGMIAALKSGCGYVPVDISMPQSRVNNIINQIQPEFVFLTEEGIEANGVEVIRPEDIEASVFHMNNMMDDHIAYTIFTSGSTGEPKGVPIKYESLNDFVKWMKSFQGETSSVWLNQAPLSFDLSVMAVYPALCSAGCLLMVDKDMIAHPKDLYEYLNCHEVQTWVSTPSFMELALMLPEFNQENHQSLSAFFFCGEVLKHKTAEKLITHFPEAEIYNTYGPTEATVAVTSVLIDEHILQQYATLPVGYSRTGVELNIENEELLIIGSALTPGYLNNAYKTAEQFYIDNGRWTYKTGDKAHIKDGMYFIDGRLDNQVKYNGYRIELEEIEEALTSIDVVLQAVVVPKIKEDRVIYLVAVLCTGGVSSEVYIKTQLKNKLPLYMIPQKIIIKDFLPLTQNGKLDRRKVSENVNDSIW